VLHEQLRDAWLARGRAVPINPVMTFTPEGLVLGAGTVLILAEGVRRLKSLQGHEARVLALLSAAYGRAIAPTVLGNIERGAKCWSAGDDCLAYIHLAHARLHTLEDPASAACRLFVADCAMKGGVSPRSIFQALGTASPCIEAVEKLYNPQEPRVPAGSGRTSGEWTDSEETGGDVAASDATTGAGAQGSSLLGRMPPAAASFLGELDAAEALELGQYAARIATPVGGAAAVFGLLFVSSPNKKARYRRFQDCTIPGIATRRCFI
jgi:hypothetical protein